MADQEINTFIPKIPEGFCQCGCGKTAPMAKRNNKRRGHFKGKPISYIQGHHVRIKGESYRYWGEKFIASSGYILIHRPSHPRANNWGYVYEHIVVAEAMLDRPLDGDEKVHHLDEIRHHNEYDNIYIFCTDGDHKKYHERLKAFRACGHWHWRKCHYCHQWDSPENLYVNVTARHRSCFRQYSRQRYHNNKITQLLVLPIYPI